MKETFDKNPAETTHNIINFLNTLFEEELRTMGIKDIITLITWAIKVIGKRKHNETIQEKEDIMLHHV